MDMKHAKLWISIVVIAVVIGLVVNNKRSAPGTAELPPSDPALAGPQEPIPSSQYNPTAPLSKNKVTYSNSMKIEITKEGTGAVIESGQTAVVNYTGRLTTGVAFDSNVDPKFQHVEPFSFTLGVGQVIKGWDQGVLGMKVGESRTLTIPSELAYGPNGMPPVIPANATLVFDVTLLAIK